MRRQDKTVQWLKVHNRLWIVGRITLKTVNENQLDYLELSLGIVASP